MILNEQEIERLITEYVLPDRCGLQVGIVGQNLAAHAIAEKMAEGVVCGAGMIVHDVDQEGNAEVYILLDSEPGELDSGQRVRVTMREE